MSPPDLRASEWCRDLYAGYDYDRARAGDGLPDVPYSPDESAPIYRGGSYLTAAVAARSAVRWVFPVDHVLGLRPSKAITE